MKDDKILKFTNKKIIKFPSKPPSNNEQISDNDKQNDKEIITIKNLEDDDGRS